MSHGVCFGTGGGIVYEVLLVFGRERLDGVLFFPSVTAEGALDKAGGSAPKQHTALFGDRANPYAALRALAARAEFAHDPPEAQKQQCEGKKFEHRSLVVG